MEHNENMQIVPQNTVTITTNNYSCLQSNSVRYNLIREYVARVLETEYKLIDTETLVFLCGLSEVDK